jgi:hypothetical protein
MLAELMRSSVGAAKWWVLSTEDHIISVPPASSLHGDVVCQGKSSPPNPSAPVWSSRK